MNKELEIKAIYRQAVATLKQAGIKSATLDARALIEFALSLDTAQFYLNQEEIINKKQAEKVDRLIRRRAKREPVAYIVGSKEFYGLDFKVTRNVLIPRPESEFLVEKSVEFIKSLSHISHFFILDMGTGSGNIIISIAKQLSNKTSMHRGEQCRFDAADKSASALKVAKQNAIKHGVDDKIEFYQSDLFNNRYLKNKKNDIIIANLPYVPKINRKSKIKSQKEIEYEPKNAIFADNNGAAVIKRFLYDAKNHLSDSGFILIEFDPRNAVYLKKHAEEIFPQAKIALQKDLAGLNRYLIIITNPEFPRLM